MRSRPHRTSVVRWITIALATLLVMPAMALPATAQPATPNPTLDLAALVLMPADLEAEGMPGYGTDWSRTFATIDERVKDDHSLEGRMAVSLAGTLDAAAILTLAGWIRSHELLLATPVDPDDPAWYHSGAYSSIEEYASPEGASSIFALFSAEGGLESSLDGTVNRLPVTTPLGDERLLAHQAFIDDGDTILRLIMMTRVDNLIVTVILTDFGNGIEPDPATMERLNARVITRIQAARDAGSGVGPCLPGGPATPGVTTGSWASPATAPHMPGFDRCAQRMIGDTTEPGWARYTVLDGTVIPTFGISEAEIAESQADVTARGIQDVYQNQYPVEGITRETFTYVFLYAYTDEAAAAADFAGAEQRWRAEPGYSELMFTPNPIAIGDESWSVSMRHEAAGTVSTMTYVRFDHIAIGIRINGTGAPIPDVVNTLLASQVACMQANDCAAPIPVPPELVAIG